MNEPSSSALAPILPEPSPWAYERMLEIYPLTEQFVPPLPEPLKRRVHAVIAACLVYAPKVSAPGIGRGIPFEPWVIVGYRTDDQTRQPYAVVRWEWDNQFLECVVYLDRYLFLYLNRSTGEFWHEEPANGYVPTIVRYTIQRACTLLHKFPFRYLYREWEYTKPPIQPVPTPGHYVEVPRTSIVSSSRRSRKRDRLKSRVQQLIKSGIQALTSPEGQVLVYGAQKVIREILRARRRRR